MLPSSIRYAHNVAGEKITPTFSGERATCPTCKGEVVAHCGEILRWHWTHLSNKVCDLWAEHLTEWHQLWQYYLELYKGAETEENITHSGITHRADAVLPDGRIIELQHATLLPYEIREREDFYGKKLVWIFDICDSYEKKRFELKKKKEDKDTFRWKHPKKSIAFAKRKVYFHLSGGSVFELIKMYPNAPCGGLGKLHHSIDLEEYINMNT